MAYAVPTGQHAGPCSCIHGKVLHTAVLCVGMCALLLCIGMCMCVFCTCVFVWPCVSLCSFLKVCWGYFGNLFGISTNEAQFSWLF